MQTIFTNNRSQVIALIFLAVLVPFAGFALGFLRIAGANEKLAESTQSFVSSNMTFPVSLSYPDGWYIDERGASERTPFAVVLSDTDISNYHGGPLHGYPDTFVNVVYYKTGASESEYATQDLQAKRVSELKSNDLVVTSGITKTYESKFKEGTYISSYRRSGEYLVIIEAYTNEDDRLSELREVYSGVVETIQFEPSIIKRITNLLLHPLTAHATGPLTLPFLEDDYSINAYFDLDDRADWVYDYAHQTPWQESVEGWELGKAYDGHKGTDYNMAVGDKVAAALGGTVSSTTDNQSNTYPGGPVTPGNQVRIDHSDDYETRYYHLETGGLQVGAGSTTARGDHIADSGNTGFSSGPHLHFGVYVEGVAEDPYEESLWMADPPTLAPVEVSSTVTSNTTWFYPGVYVVDGTVTINSGVTLTVESGAIVKFKTSSSKLVVNGTLDVNGTLANPAQFTSYHDDDRGGDTNDNGTSTTAAAGDWRSIEVNSGGTATLDHAIFRYGGNSSGSQANIYNNGGVLVMTDATSTDAANYALLMTAGTTTCTRCEMSYSWNTVYYSNGTLTITDSYIHDNGYFGILAGGPGALTVTDTTFANHDLFGAGLVTYRQGLTFVHSGNTSLNTGGTYASNYHGFFTLGNVLGDVTWYADGLPYIVYPYPYSETALGTRVPHGSSLTIEPGVIVKFASSTGYLSASGTVQAIGTSNDPIYFTSIKDDTVGGDTNDDGAATTPGKGNWLGLVFGPYGAGATGTLAYTVTRYAGGSDPWTGAYPAVGNRSSVLSIASSTIADSAYTGVVHWTTDGSTTVTTSNIQNIDSWGMYSFESGTSSAEQNYWNHSTGPWPSGSGEPVGGTVDYTPFSTSVITW